MCTVTVIALNDRAQATFERVRLVCNRDEKHTRPDALPPIERRTGLHRALMPIDPVSNGTWIGANEAGLIATLLNVNFDRDRDSHTPATWSGRTSRGEIVPRLLSASDVPSAIAMSTSLDASRFPPFRLVLVDHRWMAELRSDGAGLSKEVIRLSPTPTMFTSSGLGDALVQQPRRQLFDEMFSQTGNWLAVQDRFHRHTWPDRTHLSVCMFRTDARTVSRTEVELSPTQVTLSYVPIGAGGEGEPKTLTLTTLCDESKS